MMVLSSFRLLTTKGGEGGEGGNGASLPVGQLAGKEKDSFKSRNCTKDRNEGAESPRQSGSTGLDTATAAVGACQRICAI